MIGCGDNGGGGGNAIPTCPTTHVFDASRNACVPINGSGIVTPQTTVQYYDYNRSFQNQGGYYGGVQTYPGDMQIVNTNAYKQFLKEALAICDRNIWGYEAGLASCDGWVSGTFRLDVRVGPDLRPAVSFTAYPAPQYYQYAVSVGINGGGMAFNPLVLTTGTTFNLINDSKGFEIRANGSYMNGGGLRLIQIQVQQGTLADGFVSYELYYPYNKVATRIATGKLKRY
jgi:hypothetical protein